MATKLKRYPFRLLGTRQIAVRALANRHQLTVGVENLGRAHDDARAAAPLAADSADFATAGLPGEGGGYRQGHYPAHPAGIRAEGGRKAAGGVDQGGEYAAMYDSAAVQMIGPNVERDHGQILAPLDHA